MHFKIYISVKHTAGSQTSIFFFLANWLEITNKFPTHLAILLSVVVSQFFRGSPKVCPTSVVLLISIFEAVLLLLWTEAKKMK